MGGYKVIDSLGRELEIFFMDDEPAEDGAYEVILKAYLRAPDACPVCWAPGWAYCNCVLDEKED